MAYIPVIGRLFLCERGQKLYDLYNNCLISLTEDSFGNKMADTYYTYIEHLFDCKECHYEKPNFLKNGNENFSDNLELRKEQENG